MVNKKVNKKIEEDVLSPIDEITKEEVIDILKDKEVTTEKRHVLAGDLDLIELNECMIELKKELEEQKKSNAMLLEVADTKKLSNYYARNSKSVPKRAKLRTMEGKVIIGWKAVSNIANAYTSKGGYFEDQRTELLFEDDTTQVMYMLDFSRNYSYIDVKIISTMVDEETKQVMFKVECVEGGKQYNISSKFIN